MRRLFILSQTSSASQNGYFMYFGFASNLLSKRVHVQNHTAVRKYIGVLKDHRLDFVGFSKYWGGASATVVPRSGESVWGSVWQIDMLNLPDLDRQEGVHENIYFPKTVDIHLNNGQTIACRVYEKTDSPPENSPYPCNEPSEIYLKVIIEGAIESGLPDTYIEKLKSMPHNSHYDQELANLFGV